MRTILPRRLLLGGMLASAAGAALAGAPESSPRPRPRPLRGGAAAAPDAERLIAEAKLGGTVGYVVADAVTGGILEGRNGRQPMAPASTAKALTTLYALDRLGGTHRFRTRLVAAGPLAGGRIEGDLVLAGGGDPTLDTEGLAVLARDLRAAGVREVVGRLRYWGGALPAIREIAPGQPEHLGYNPAICGLNLNFNRVYFEWKRQGAGYSVSMDARSDRRRPEVSSSRMEVKSRKAPLYTYVDGSDAELWTVARAALGKGGGRWLPVRHPARYAAEVFRQLARTEGVAIPGYSAASRPPSGAVLAERASEDLLAIARDMLRYSTNMTAEVLGLAASGAGSLRDSAAAMDAHLAQEYGCTARMVDHSGLGPQSRVTAEDMVAALVAAAPGGPLRSILRRIEIQDPQGKARGTLPLDVRAKTGTLNFVSCLAGYCTAPGGRLLAFAFFAGDLSRRSALDEEERDHPAGAASWNARAKALQHGLLERWGRLYAA